MRSAKDPGGLMQLFCPGGIHNVSIRRIAEIIEYSPTTIYLYFKKDEIFFNCMKLFSKKCRS